MSSQDDSRSSVDTGSPPSSPAGQGGESRKIRLALVLTGGGARGAYQVGVLRGLGRHFPELTFPIITGVSAGAINAVYVASRQGGLDSISRRLAAFWRSIQVDDVVESNWSWLMANFAKWTTLLGTGSDTHARALLDTEPLRRMLSRVYEDKGGPIPGIDENLKSGDLEAVAISSVNYGTGQTVTWVQGRDVDPWHAPNRVGRLTRLKLEHVMASAALPLIFPAVELEDGWHGDGGIRFAAPLSPALHLGADRILAISTRYARSDAEAAESAIDGYPAPAQIAGNLMNAIFLDLLDQDVQRLERTNRLVRRIPEEERDGVRPVDLTVIRPSVDLGRLSSQFEPQLPKGYNFLTKNLGAGQTRSPDFLSLLMFEGEYARQLIEIGERDVESQLDTLKPWIQTILDSYSPKTSGSPKSSEDSP